MSKDMSQDIFIQGMIVQGRKTHRIFLTRAPPTTGWEASTDAVRESLTEGAAQLGKVSVHSNLLFGLPTCAVRKK